MPSERGSDSFRSVVILSGGLDSAVSAAIAKEETEVVLALYFDYGQRSARAEQKAATAVAQHLDISLRTIGLPWLAELGSSALTNRDALVPELTDETLDNRTHTKKTARAVWVPNRNGVFLNSAAAFAEGLDATLIVTGFNAEEAVTFPDNSADFVEAADRFFSYATLSSVRVTSYTQTWDKERIVREGLKRNLPFEILWSCYTEGVPPVMKMCGVCESCQRSIRAYRRNNIWERMKIRFQEQKRCK